MLMRANYIIGDGAVEQILLFLFSLFALWTYAGAIALWKKHPVCALRSLPITHVQRVRAVVFFSWCSILANERLLP